MPEWINFQKRKPSRKDRILLTFDGFKIREDCWFDGNHWMQDCPMDYYGRFEGKITHYMLYPDEPKKQTCRFCEDPKSIITPETCCTGCSVLPCKQEGKVPICKAIPDKLNWCDPTSLHNLNNQID